LLNYCVLWLNASNKGENNSPIFKESNAILLFNLTRFAWNAAYFRAEKHGCDISGFHPFGGVRAKAE